MRDSNSRQIAQARRGQEFWHKKMDRAPKKIFRFRPADFLDFSMHPLMYLVFFGLITQMAHGYKIPDDTAIDTPQHPGAIRIGQSKPLPEFTLAYEFTRQYQHHIEQGYTVEDIDKLIERSGDLPLREIKASHQQTVVAKLLSTAIRELNIRVEKSLRNHPDIEHFKTRIKKLLPETLPSILLNSILNHPTFCLMLACNTPKLGNADGKIYPMGSTVLIRFQPSIDDNYLLAALKNELLTFGTVHVNVKKFSGEISDIANFMWPMIDSRGNVDKIKIAELINSIQKGFALYTSLLSQRNTVHLHELVSQYYEPRKLFLALDREAFKRFFKPTHTKDIYLSTTQNMNVKITGLEISKDKVSFYVCFAVDESLEQKTHAFHQQMKNILHLHLESGAYADRDASSQWGELVSTIWSDIPTQILEYLFPDLCEYLSKYHQVDNYCKTESNSAFRH